MRVSRPQFMVLGVFLFAVLLLPAAPARASTDMCATGHPGVGFGDGSDGDLLVSAGMVYDLPPNRNYHNVTVANGGTLNTRGDTLRVCGTLTNHGIITDSYSGAAGGTGGAGGRGADPWLDNEWPACGLRADSCGEGGTPGYVA